MKHHLLAAMIVAVSAFLFPGCANNQPATPEDTSNTDPARKTYTQHDLERSGEARTGRALQKVDPDISR